MIADDMTECCTLLEIDAVQLYKSGGDIHKGKHYVHDGYPKVYFHFDVYRITLSTLYKGFKIREGTYKLYKVSQVPNCPSYLQLDIGPELKWESYVHFVTSELSGPPYLL